MIQVCEPSLGQEEIDNAIKCLQSNRISGFGGAYIKELESNFADYCGRKYAVSVSSCGAATLVSLEALRIGSGDEVIVNTFTMAAPLFAIVRAGAIPVLVDVERESWNMDASQIKHKITKRTKAIIVAHVYGHPADMQVIMEIADHYHLPVIEDAAEVLGAEAYGAKCGGIGHIGNFSLYFNKIITTGEGGMIITDSKEVADRARLIKSYATDVNNRFVHNELGFNFRLSNLQAAVGCAQFKKLEAFTKRKIEIAARYTQNLKDTELELPTQMSWAKHCYWVYALLVNKDGISRDGLIEALARHNIESRHFFIPMHQQPIFLKRGLFRKESYPISDDISRRGLYLPNGVTLTDEQIDYISDVIKQCV